MVAGGKSIVPLQVNFHDSLNIILTNDLFNIIIKMLLCASVLELADRHV